MFGHLDSEEANLSPTLFSFGALARAVADKVPYCVKKLSAASGRFWKNKIGEWLDYRQTLLVQASSEGILVLSDPLLSTF